MDPEQLARRAARGDHHALEALFRLHQEDVWRYCLALLGDRDLAQEAAQDTFMRAVTAIRRFKGRGPVKVWLLVIARRAAAGVLKRERGRRLGTPTDPAELESPSPDQFGEVELAALVAALPEELRAAFVLTQQLGLSYAEAAAVVDCKVGTIRSRVFRARERLVAAITVQRLDGQDGLADSGG